MNSNEILFIGIGQAGNNLASEVVRVNKRINAVCINTSQDDIKAIENISHTFVVPGASGTGRNRTKAKMYVKDQIYGITDILKDYPQQKFIYIAFSMGGGTGSGITPALLAVLAKMNPNLKVNLVPILPFDSESKKAHENTLACWNELVNLPNINSVYLIDNNKRKTKNAINKEFASLFKEFLETTAGHKDGNVDGAELELLGTAKGLSAIYRLDKYIDEPKKLLSKSVLENSIFVIEKTKCEYLGLSVPEGFNVNPILDIYTITEDYFVGINSDNPLLMVSGSTLDASAVKHVKDNLDEKNLLMKQQSEEEKEEVALKVEFEPSSKPEKVEKAEPKSIDDLLDDDDSFWNDIMNM